MPQSVIPGLGSLDVFYRKRMTAAFTSERIGDSAVRDLLRAAVHAPTVDATAFVIVQEPSLLARLGDMHGATTLIIVCAKPMGSQARDECWRATENLILASSALGLACCPVRSILPALFHPALKRELGIRRDVTPVLPLVVGIPANAPPVLARRDPEILTWKQ
jgi:hypothetical protein